MAAADYCPCDVCKGKAFYDANLSYDDEGPSVRITGQDVGYPSLGNLGDWTVLCIDCATRFRTAIVPIEEESAT